MNDKTRQYTHKAGTEAYTSNHIPILSIGDIWENSVIDSIISLQFKLVGVDF